MIGTRRLIGRGIFVAGLLAIAGPAAGQPTLTQQQILAHEIAQLDWFDGPNTIEIAGVAGFDIPANYQMLTPPDSLKFLTLNGNAVTAADVGDYVLQNADPNSTWFAILSYENPGHISDSQPIDAAQLLATMEQASDLDNQNRAKQNIPPMDLTGWALEPSYDQTTHRLEWAFNFTNADGTTTANVNAVVLGRTGDLKIIMVDDPQNLPKDIPDFNNAMSGFSFNVGQRYEDTQPNDQAAPYTLATLIGGGPPPAATPRHTPPPPPPPHHANNLLKALLALVALAAVSAVALWVVAGRRS
jgi:uncharacterized membrane-anchored protein